MASDAVLLCAARPAVSNFKRNRITAIFHLYTSEDTEVKLSWTAVVQKQVAPAYLDFSLLHVQGKRNLW